VQTLFLALALYPEVQKKAQAEIDAVVGPNRLPDFDDRPFLPYINAVIKESMRWHLVVPLGGHVLSSFSAESHLYVLS
jgi:cytochrome P450